MSRRTSAQVYMDNCKAATVRYLASNSSELYQVYGRYSRAKEKAMDQCKEIMHMMDGYGLRITSHNTNVFSVMFEYVDQDGQIMLHEITRYNSHDYEYIPG